jgi:hypothetical protein
MPQRQWESVEVDGCILWRRINTGDPWSTDPNLVTRPNLLPEFLQPAYAVWVLEYRAIDRSYYNSPLLCYRAASSRWRTRVDPKYKSTILPKLKPDETRERKHLKYLWYPALFRYGTLYHRVPLHITSIFWNYMPADEFFAKGESEGFHPSMIPPSVTPPSTLLPTPIDWKIAFFELAGEFNEPFHAAVYGWEVTTEPVGIYGEDGK